MYKLERTIEKLRDPHRIKYGIDYSITHKYNELHLLCHEVFLDKIVEVAQSYNISFNSTHTYK